MDYTAEDMEQYIEYAKKLYDMVNIAFQPPQARVEKPDSDPMEKYVQAMQVVLTSQAGIVEKLYFSLLKPFQIWLMDDCPLTGHKGKH